MAVNKFAADCSVCGCQVPAQGGTLKKSGRSWRVTHLDCAQGGGGSIAITFNSGATVYQNRRGRCIDAPCCGCCT